MIKSLLAFLFLISSYALMADSVVTNKQEVELKVALTKNGYTALKKALMADYKTEESERTDYYFDVFKNGHYILRDLSQPVKLRFMNGGDSLKWQNQKVVKTGSRSVFSIKTTEASEIELKHDNVFFEMIDSYFEKLSKKDSYATTLAANIESEMIKKEIIASPANYFATHSNHKKRIKIKLKIENDQFSVQLGETNNRGVMSYEMEAEIKKSSDINKSADRLNTWLQSLGFQANHIDISVPVDPTLWSETLLNELFVFGVQDL